MSKPTPKSEKMLQPSIELEEEEEVLEEEEEEQEQENGGGDNSIGAKIACLAVGAVAAVAAPIAIPAAAAAIGFGAGGIAAGSTAATMMSVAWKTGQGVWLVSSLQSIGAAGLGATASAGVGTAAGAIGYKITSFFTRK